MKTIFVFVLSLCICLNQIWAMPATVNTENAKADAAVELLEPAESAHHHRGYHRHGGGWGHYGQGSRGYGDYGGGYGNGYGAGYGGGYGSGYGGGGGGGGGGGWGGGGGFGFGAGYGGGYGG